MGKLFWFQSFIFVSIFTWFFFLFSIGKCRILVRSSERKFNVKKKKFVKIIVKSESASAFMSVMNENFSEEFYRILRGFVAQRLTMVSVVPVVGPAQYIEEIGLEECEEAVRPNEDGEKPIKKVWRAWEPFLSSQAGERVSLCT